MPHVKHCPEWQPKNVKTSTICAGKKRTDQKAYAEGWDRIWGKKSSSQDSEPSND